MDPISAIAFMYSIPVVNKIIDAAVRYGFDKLTEQPFFFEVLKTLNISHPKNTFRSLYLHTTFLFASKGKPKELIQLILSENAVNAFESEVKKNEQGLFKKELDHALHVSPEIREIKHWQEVPQIEIDEFLKIYRDFVYKVATPVENELLTNQFNTLKGIEELNKASQTGFSSIDKKLSQLDEKMRQIPSMATEDSRDPLQNEYDRQLNVLSQRIKEGKYKTCLESLRQLQKDIWDKSDSTVRFKLLTNIGVCYYELERFNEAAQYLIDAYEYSPDSETALNNIVNGYFLLGDIESAENYYNIFFEKHGESSERVWTCHLNLHYEQKRMDAVIADIPSKFKNRPIILECIGLRYEKLGYHEEAFRYLKQAYERQPEGSIVLNYLQIRLERFNGNYKILNQRIVNQYDRKEIDSLLALIDKLYESFKDTELIRRKAYLLSAKSFLFHIIGEVDRAIEIIDQAIEFEKDDAFLQKQKATIYAYAGDTEKAITILSQIDNLSQFPELELFLAEACKKVGDTQRAMELFEHILYSSGDDFSARQAREMLTSLYVDLNLRHKISELKEAGFNELDIMDCICLSRIYYYEKKPEDAKKILLSAKSQINNSTAYKDVLFLAEEFERCEFYFEAINLYERIVDKDVESLTVRLYKLYYRIGDKAQSLTILKNLRKKNGPLKRATKDEIKIYQEYGDYVTAREIAESYTETYPDELPAKLIVAGLHFRLNELEKANEFFKSDIDYFSFSDHERATYVSLLVSSGNGGKALNVAYEIRRRDEGSEANDLFLRICFEFPHLLQSYPDPERVERDCVVTLSTGGGDSFSLTVEDRPKKELRTNEINFSDPRFAAVNEKKIGAKVSLDGLGLKKWKIERIEHKYSFAFFEAQYKSSTIYEGKSDFRRFHVNEFWDVIKKLGDKNWAEKYQRLLAHYKQRQLGIGSFAEILNRDPVLVWKELRSNDKVGIQAAAGAAAEIKDSIEGLHGRRLCADVTALLVLYELGIGQVVIEKFGKILITTTTEDVILGYKANSLQFNQTGVIPQEVEDFVTFIKTTTEAMVPSVAMIRGIQKDKLDKLLGRSFVDSILLAKEKSAVLYSDDYVTREIAKNEHQVNGVCSQSLLYFLATDHSITGEVYSRNVMDLIELNVRYTSINCHLLYSALIESKGKYDAPFVPVLRVLTGDRTSEESAIRTGLMFLLLVWTRLDFSNRVQISIWVLEVLCTNREIVRVLSRLRLLLDRGLRSSAESHRDSCQGIVNAIDQFENIYHIDY